MYIYSWDGSSLEDGTSSSTRLDDSSFDVAIYIVGGTVATPLMYCSVLFPTITVEIGISFFIVVRNFMMLSTSTTSASLIGDPASRDDSTSIITHLRTIFYGGASIQASMPDAAR